ncbi:MAG: small subunit ribosomal protein [Thermoleophilaceae bacterium]|jgi:small subunit ribosomal protein S17|nr:small subunit ribosomal protein [Thermoleophilaceae bacterium]
MLDTDDNVNEETPGGDAPADEAPDQVAEEVVAPEEPAEEPTADEVAEESAPEEAAPEEPPAAKAPATAAAPAADEEPVEALGPKERRRQKRSAHTGEARPARTVEERVAERAERRSTKAKQRRAYRQKQRERRASEPREQAPDQTAVEQSASGSAKTRQGIVVSDKADKTIIVRIDSARAHRMYKKIVRSSSTLHAHDEQNEAHVGDTVRVIESRPLSRTKRWRLVEVLERAR